MKLQQLTMLYICTAALFLNVFAKPVPATTDSSQAIADRIINSDIPVLVDFWATWCGPCRMLNPIIHKLEQEYKGKVLFVKVNVDIHRALSSYFSVSSIPAIFIIHNKNVIKAMAGVQSKAHYQKVLDDILNNTAQSSSSSQPSKGNTVQ